MAKSNLPDNIKQLYLVSFIEGGVVMVTELAGAKLLTPFFGTSLYSWASTLAITLLALMLGYYYGGYVTTKPGFTSVKKILWVFFLSGLTVLLMPLIGHLVMKKTISFSFLAGLIISELIFLFPPIFLMGMISPMIIFNVTQKAEQSGRSAGNIYAISTSGGILFTLIFGFSIIPDYGISLPVKVLGLSVCILALYLLFKERTSAKKIPIALLLTFLISAVAFKKNNDLNKNSNTKILEQSEGLLGELKVTDQLVQGLDGKPLYIRKLKANNTQQNYVFTAMPTQSLLYYVNFTQQLIPLLPRKESALLVGLGAGSLYKILCDYGIKTETVEIDKRIYDMGVKYFGMAKHEDHFITDGRYFLNTTKKKYDLIIIDCIIGENVPGQLVTLESFTRCKDLLTPNGTLLVEYGGVKSFSDNPFIPSVSKTLSEAGFHVNIFNPLKVKNGGDILFVATKNKFELDNLNISSGIGISAGPLADYSMPMNIFDNSRTCVLTDDINNIDILLKDHYLTARKGIRRDIEKENS